MKQYDIIIIGAGPAGLSAAIYAARSNHKTLILDKGECLKFKSGFIENYFGFPDGIEGQELLNRGCEHARKFGAEIKMEEALGVKMSESGNYVIYTDKSEYETKGIIIAMGVSYKKVKIENLEKFEGKGISYCVVCDGFFFRNKRVCVIGSKNYAATEALELTNYSSDVTIFTNGDKMEIDIEILKKIEEKNIKINNEKILRFVGDEILKGILLENGETIPMDGVFIAIGSSGPVDIARKLGVLTQDQYVIVDKRQKTNLPRVYAAGDCTGGNKQIATAVGQGADAALNLVSELEGILYVDYKKSK